MRLYPQLNLLCLKLSNWHYTAYNMMNVPLSSKKLGWARTACSLGNTCIACLSCPTRMGGLERLGKLLALALWALVLVVLAILFSGCASTSSISRSYFLKVSQHLFCVLVCANLDIGEPVKLSGDQGKPL